MSFLEEYPQLKIVQQLARTRKTDVFLVGGFVRDYFLGRQRYDFDFAVEKGAILFARVFAKKIRGAFVLLDRGHGCARVAKKKKDGIYTYDFADYRAKSFNLDLSHRDFTINTVAIDIRNIAPDGAFSDVIIDCKKGMRDIKNKKIIMTSVRVFKEDPLRLMRAFSLKATLGFFIEGKTAQQIKKDVGRIHSVSAERIRDELFKILESDNAALVVKEIDRIGLLKKIIPQIAVMYGVRQGTYHHLDVWPHSLESLLQFEKLMKAFKDSEEIMSYLKEPIAGQRSRYSLIKLACILHDIGKPDAKRVEGRRTIFHAHERIGRNITRIVARNLKLATAERHALEDMVLWHLRPGYLSNFKAPSERAYFRYFRDTKKEAASIALLSLADQRSTCGPLTTEQDQRHHEKVCKEILSRYFNQLHEQPFVRIINGNDLIKRFKLEPSPLFAVILREIEEKQVIGKIRTKKEAFDIAAQLIKKNKKRKK